MIDVFDFAQLHSELGTIRTDSAAVQKETTNVVAPHKHPKLPETTLDWTDWIIPNYEEHVGGGGSCEAWMGKWVQVPEFTGEIPRVVVKVIRESSSLSHEASEKLYKVSI